MKQGELSMDALKSLLDDLEHQSDDFLKRYIDGTIFHKGYKRYPKPEQWQEADGLPYGYMKRWQEPPDVLPLQYNRTDPEFILKLFKLFTAAYFKGFIVDDSNTPALKYLIEIYLQTF